MTIRASGARDTVQHGGLLRPAAAGGVILEIAFSSEAGVPGFTIEKSFKANEYEAKLEFIERR